LRSAARVACASRRATPIAEVTALAPDCFRVGLFGSGRPAEYPDHSVTAPDPVAAELTEAEGRVELATDEARAILGLDPLRISFTRADGSVLAADDPELGMGFVPAPDSDWVGSSLGPAPLLHKRRGEGERFFGCGERTSGLEKTASRQIFWNVDPPQGHTASFNNLYTSIPFVLSLQDGRAHGLFVDYPGRSVVDLAKAEPGLVTWSVASGDLVYYVFCGPTPARVVEQVHRADRAHADAAAVGARQPPVALELHERRRGARDRGGLPRARHPVRRALPRHRLHARLPRLHVRLRALPGPAGLIAELGEQGFRIVTIVDPGVKVDEDSDVYREGRDQGLFCRTFADREYRNVVWPGLCAFPDFTNARTRAWWGGHHQALVDRASRACGAT
jgi:alpha-glucosidase